MRASAEGMRPSVEGIADRSRGIANRWRGIADRPVEGDRRPVEGDRRPVEGIADRHGARTRSGASRRSRTKDDDAGERIHERATSALVPAPTALPAASVVGKSCSRTQPGADGVAALRRRAATAGAPPGHRRSEEQPRRLVRGCQEQGTGEGYVGRGAREAQAAEDVPPARRQRGCSDSPQSLVIVQLALRHYSVHNCVQPWATECASSSWLRRS
jgi:hypothetical protein